MCFKIISMSRIFCPLRLNVWFAPQLFPSSTPTQCPWLWTREGSLASSVRSTEYLRPTSPGRETDYLSTPLTTGNVYTLLYMYRTLQYVTATHTHTFVYDTCNSFLCLTWTLASPLFPDILFCQRVFSRWLVWGRWMLEFSAVSPPTLQTLATAMRPCSTSLVDGHTCCMQYRSIKRKYLCGGTFNLNYRMCPCPSDFFAITTWIFPVQSSWQQSPTETDLVGLRFCSLFYGLGSFIFSVSFLLTTYKLFNNHTKKV